MVRQKILALISIAAFSAMAIEVDVSPTIIRINAPASLDPATRTQIQTIAQNQINIMSDSIEAQSNAAFSKYTTQRDLAKGFGNANAYSSQSGTLYGWNNYKLFNVSGGMLFALQMPSFDVGYLSAIGDDIQEKGDLYAGLAVGASINIGVNASMLVPGLYVNARWFNFEPPETEGFAFKQSLIGLGASYKVFDPVGMSLLAKWKGLTVNSGIYYQSSDIALTFEAEPVEQSISMKNGQTDPNVINGLNALQLDSVTMSNTPSFEFGFESGTTTIPVEVVTSVQVLYLVNLGFAAGVDFNFGGTDITVKSTSNTEISTKTGNAIETDTAGIMLIDASTKGESASFMRMHVAVAPGLNLGPMKVEVPFVWYMSSGLSFGVTAGIVF